MYADIVQGEFCRAELVAERDVRQIIHNAVLIVRDPAATGSIHGERILTLTSISVDGEVELIGCIEDHGIGEHRLPPGRPGRGE